jgi:hypothetical protein
MSTDLIRQTENTMHVYRRTIAALWMIGLGLHSGIASSADTKTGQFITSPNGQMRVDFQLTDAGAPRYSVALNNQPVLDTSRLGLVRDDIDFTSGLRLIASSEDERVVDDYVMLTSKRRQNHYAANRKTFHLQTAAGAKLDLIFQVSDDGVAFRYYFPQPSSTMRSLRREASSFQFLPQTKAWLQPIAVAKSGWNEVNPSYEELYSHDVMVGTPSPTGAGWAYPALFRSGETWLLVSEGSLPANFSASRLRNEWRSREYTVSYPDPLEGINGGAVNPESTLPWLTPWRFVVIGSLKTIVESTLGTDLADPPDDDAWIPQDGPGKASFSWPLLGDDQTTYAVQKRFIDYAAQMGWQYTLIDALWDKQIGYDKLQDLADYAHKKGVKLLLWYNSAGDWNTTPQTPRGLMLTHESRMREFQRIAAMGVAGIKVEFFAGDGQSTIAYYQDILVDAAKLHLLVNFHGATLPRGWQRTYPNLMTMAAVRGLKYVTFEQKNAEDEPSHAAMLPFTRNVFDPMDFTPMVLDHINRIERRTTSAFELALSVLFTSGIQHYAESPEGMSKAPEYVRDFLKHVPSVWDDVKFIAGDPGKLAIIARLGDGRWYIAGINGEIAEKRLHLPLLDIPAHGKATLITDGPDGTLSFRRDVLQLNPDQTIDITLKPRGGFVLVFE